VTWLLDTNVVSELRKGERSNPNVRAWQASTRGQDKFISVLVLGEIRRGIESARRRDVPQAIALEQWLMRLTETFRDRVLPVDARIADRWGVLSVPDPPPTADGLLAATALVHELTLVTRNVHHVERTGVRLLDPFSNEASD
jgi:predicted nucleic acid-binding protein